jgi:exopolysaccharide biosynthesis polyprenyl glycosylphosphotransferase
VNHAPKYPWSGWHIALVDALLIAVSFVLSYVLRYEVEFLRPVDEFNSASFPPFIPYTLVFMAWVLLLNQGAGLYQSLRDRTLVSEFFKLTNSASNAAILVMALSFLLRPLVFSRLLIVQGAFITVLLLSLWRVSIRLIRNFLHHRGVGVENVLLVGAGEVGRSIIRTIVARPDLGYRLVGFLDDDLERGQQDIGRVPALGMTTQVVNVLESRAVDLVIITLPWRAQPRVFEIIQECEQKNIAVRIVPDIYQFNLSQVHVEMLGGLPLLGTQPDTGVRRGTLIAKRIMDILFTVLVMPLVLPIMLVTAIAIRLESDGPILFYQKRLGYKGREFYMVKFRSMIDNAEDIEEEIVKRTTEDPEGKHARQDDDPRITWVGHFIRRTSIDELPQFINILRGEMSLVGPRPALPQEVVLYKPWVRQRMMVRPGLTGLWQVSGRADIPFEEKALLDIYYIENWSLGLDLQILLQTAPQVFFPKGAY